MRDGIARRWEGQIASRLAAALAKLSAENSSCLTHERSRLSARSS